MNNFKENIRPFVEQEINKSKTAFQNKQYDRAFVYLENAHVLGQISTYWHVKVHYLMLIWGVKRKNLREVIGQLIRIFGAAFLTSVKGVPEGNTGGSNVSPIKPMPIDPNFAEIIKKAKNPES